MLRFHFFTAKQGTWVYKDDRGPLWREHQHKLSPGDISCRRQFLPATIHAGRSSA